MKTPGLINIDVCGLCNRTCNYCPRSSSYPNEKEYMSIELFKKFVFDLDGYTGIVCFTGRGENSLHPYFGALAKILNHPTRTYKTRIISNGYKLWERKHYFELFDIIILNSYDSIEMMEKRKELFPNAYHRYWDQNMEPEEWGETVVQVMNRTEMYEGTATDKSQINTPCVLPSVKIWIHWDGTIQKCCNDWTNTDIFGNIETDNILDVWKSKKFVELQQNLLKGNRACNKVCSTCNRKLDARDKQRLKWLTA